MSSRRCIRVSEAIRSELASHFQRNEAIKDALVTITNVETSPDLKHSYIYITMIDPEKDRDYILSILNRHKNEWQGIIGRNLKTKYTPRLHFSFDASMERGNRVLDIITEIEMESKPHGKRDEIPSENEDSGTK